MSVRVTPTLNVLGQRVDRLLSRAPGPLPWTFDDGGRARAGLPMRRNLGDCAIRAIAIATVSPYAQVREDLTVALEREWEHDWDEPLPARLHPDYGVPRRIIGRYLELLGWVWRPLMGIGTGCQYHLAIGEVPDLCIARVSKHITAVVGGVVRDTHDPCRAGSRCVYGVYHPSWM